MKFCGFLTDNSWENTSYLQFTHVCLCTVVANPHIVLLSSIKLGPNSKTNRFI